VAAVERLVEVSRLTGGGGDNGQAEPDGTGMDVVADVARLLAPPQRGVRVCRSWKISVASAARRP
jgi:hypothetical protein